jgi:hypothetical protein
MKTLLSLLKNWNSDFSYPIAEGEEEYRVKREILLNMKQGGSRTALDIVDECGSLRPNRKNSNDP